MKVKTKWLGLALLLTLVALAAWHRNELAAQDWAAWIANFGWAGPGIFIGLYALATLALLPGLAFSLAGGALFGLGWGTFYNLTGATLGAGLAFLAARGVLGDWATTQTQGRLAPLQAGIEREGWRFVAFVRLVPLFPFNLLNYALGLTRIGFWPYLLATYIFMLPGAWVYTFLGAVGREAASGETEIAQWAPKALLAVGALALVVYLPKLYTNWRKQPMKTIQIHQLQELLTQPELLLLDLRDEADCQTKGMIAQATNIPFPLLPERLATLEPWKNQPVALICTTSFRSQRAYQLLQEGGFLNLTVVEGGMKAWGEQGLPLQQRQG